MSCRFRACGIVTQARPSAAAGRTGLLLVTPFPECCSGGWSAVAAGSDRDGVAAAGADGLCVRVVGDGDAVVPQLADQARDLSRGGDLHGTDVVLNLVPGEDDGQGGQVPGRLPLLPYRAQAPGQTARPSPTRLPDKQGKHFISPGSPVHTAEARQHAVTQFTTPPQPEQRHAAAAPLAKRQMTTRAEPKIATGSPMTCDASPTPSGGTLRLVPDKADYTAR
jgi:hypothetical protein